MATSSKRLYKTLDSPNIGVAGCWIYGRLEAVDSTVSAALSPSSAWKVKMIAADITGSDSVSEAVMFETTSL